MESSCRSPFAALARASAGLSSSMRLDSTSRSTTPDSTSLPRRNKKGSPALLVKTAASYTGAAIYKDEAFQARKALTFSSLNILTQKLSPKLRENHKKAPQAQSQPVY